MRQSLRYFTFGVFVTLIFTVIALHGNNVRWQTEAHAHCAAVWRMDLNTGKLRWQWLDDYFSEELEMMYTTPTPEPMERL